MIPWEVVGRERAPDGGELVLSRRGEEFVIRVDGAELMSSRLSHSEEELARGAAARLAGRSAQRVLVGGLGMGFTTRAALDAFPADTGIVVVEIVPAVVAWNRGAIAHLAGRPLDDPRVRVEPGDVGRMLAQTKVRFDAILLDVDNGPQGLTRRANELLYTDVGLGAARRALRPGGVLAVWSAGPDAAFERRLGKAGFKVEVEQARGRGAAGGPKHTIFYGRLPAVVARR